MFYEFAFNLKLIDFLLIIISKMDFSANWELDQFIREHFEDEAEEIVDEFIDDYDLNVHTLKYERMKNIVMTRLFVNRLRRF
jgi:hypothetical protein